MRKLRSIQVLRAVAACSVVVLHSYLRSGHSGEPEIHLGAAGVDLFFVISGFIMANVSQGRTARQFMFDRLWRIYPMWWFAALPWFFALRPTFQSYLSTLTLWPVWGYQYAYPTPLLGWTLCFEMLFYAAMALALLTRPAIPLILFAMSAVLAQTTNVPLFAFAGNPLILEFLAGVCIARAPRNERVGIALLAVGGVALAFSPLSFFTDAVAIEPHQAAVRVMFWGVPAAITVYACLCLERQFANRLWNVAVLLGDASYSIYLFHLIIINALPFAWQAEVVISILGGLLMYLLLERRIPEFRKDLRAWRQRRRDRTAGEARA